MSLAYLIRKLIEWIRYLLSKWLKITLGAIAIALLFVTYNYLKPKVYFAKTSFVLENTSGGLGELGSLASLAGFNLGGISEGSVLFQSDNIQDLYLSNRMIRETLLTPESVNNELLIKRFANSSKLTGEWESIGVSLSDFDKPQSSFTRKQDSLILESIEIIKEQFLSVGKPNRKATILEVGFQHRDETLAKEFSEKHVKNVNEFYTETKTKKTSANLQILQIQTDSVKSVLDESILRLAQIDENIPNPNPIYKTSQVPYQKAMIDVQANGAIYQELVKQLELAKVAQRNQEPLIQVIDRPFYPLENNRWKLLKAVVIGGFVGGVFMILYFLLSQIVRAALMEEKVK